eukprot:1056559-Rhodomonas_salina.1
MESRAGQMEKFEVRKMHFFFLSCYAIMLRSCYDMSSTDRLSCYALAMRCVLTWPYHDQEEKQRFAEEKREREKKEKEILDEIKRLKK